MSDYHEDTEGRKKALSANEKFCKQDVSEFAARTTVKDTKSAIETLIKQRQVEPRAIDFLHNASWHLTQALKIIDGVK